MISSEITPVRWTRILLLLLVCLLAAASEGCLGRTGNAGTRSSQVPFQTIAKGQRSGIGASSQMVIRNQAEMTALWKKHTSFEANPAPPPTIDFSKEMAVGIFLGEKPTGGHEVEILRIDKESAGVSVSFVERQPQAGSIVTQAFTQPFHIVRLSDQGSATFTFRRLP